MAKKPTVTTIASGYYSRNALNTNFEALRDAFDNTLSLDGSTPNSMGADLDMNSNDILNAGSVSATSITVGGVSLAAQVAAAAASAAAASTSETNAASSETAAAASAAAAAASFDEFDDIYLGVFASDPVTDNDGDPLATGAIYFNSVTSEWKIYTGVAWAVGIASGSGALLAASNLSDLGDAATSRTNLGVAIGTDVQAYDANLTSFVSAFTLPTSDGTSGQVLQTNGAGTISFADPASPFAPTTVSGTTPSLNVGTYNFFDNGTLSGDTTISFTSVPTEARWTYTANAGTASTFDISALVYTGKFYNTKTEGTPGVVRFSSDGTSMYVLETSSDTIFQYTLSTAWDVSTASYASKSFATTAQDTAPYGFDFSSDGTKLYIIGITSDTVYQYTLSTAWDLSTASYASKSLSVAAQDSNPFAIAFSSDGTKLYLSGTINDTIFQYTLSTAWDVSTGSYASKSLSVATYDTTPRDIAFSSDGTSLYVVGSFSRAINEFSLSTAWDISTGSFASSTPLGFTGNSPTGVAFSTDGSRLYITEGLFVLQSECSTGYTITLPASVQNSPKELVPSGGRVSYTFWTTDGGSTVYLTDEEVV